MTYSAMAWFDTCVRPPWQPPNYLFGIVWPILYTIYAYILFRQWGNTPIRNTLLIGLALNLSWVPTFTANPQLALGLLTAMIYVAVITQRVLYTSKSAKLQWLLFSPYTAWLLFAWTLNAYIAAYC